MQNITINERQMDNLKLIVKSGKMDYDSAELDRRSIRALAARDLVKITETKKGVFVQPTAKGKKLN
jgi:hypothetical protein